MATKSKKHASKKKPPEQEQIVLRSRGFTFVFAAVALIGIFALVVSMMSFAL